MLYSGNIEIKSVVKTVEQSAYLCQFSLEDLSPSTYLSLSYCCKNDLAQPRFADNQTIYPLACPLQSEMRYDSGERESMRGEIGENAPL